MLSTPQRLRAFFLSFVLTVMLAALLCGFVAVDRSTENYGFQALSPVITLDAASDGSLAVNWMGKTVRLPLGRFIDWKSCGCDTIFLFRPVWCFGSECLALMRLGGQASGKPAGADVRAVGSGRVLILDYRQPSAQKPRRIPAGLLSGDGSFSGPPGRV
jgi:hypothetical protein